MYDTQTDTWVKKQDMPRFRLHFTTVVVDGKIYVIGGKIVDNPFKATSTNLVEVYDPLTNKWEKRAEAYDTGFRAGTAKGKRSTSWGKLKAKHQK